MNDKPLSAQKSGATPLRFPQQGNAHQDNKIWIWTAVNHFTPGILGWVVGDHRADTFKPLWAMVSLWQCFFYVTDGFKVYPQFIPDGDQIVCKTPLIAHDGW
ncbi:MAG: IS1 family transposase [Leptolyngbya sp. SIO1D8]|nr:IS1 family transposase [Leptolyngbya sp. SIO1D8]